jgi:signal transduction histidine kinase
VLSTRAQLLARHLAVASVDEDDREVLADDVARLLADSSGLADVVDDLLAASEPAGTAAGCTDLRSVASDAVESLRPLGVERDVRVELAPLTEAAPAAVDVSVAAPPLRRCLVALIDNGVRHSPVGGTVTVAWGVRSGSGVLTVTDTGPGIPDAVRGRLFDRFASGDRSGAGGRRRYGLGLALVADTVHRFAGEVDVQTGPGGTTFVLTLPRCREHDAPARAGRVHVLRSL